MSDAEQDVSFAYAEVETLLAKIFGAESVQKSAFRGRLKHLKRMGVPLDTSIGQGKKTTYTEDHVHQWCFALELEQFDIDPKSIGKIIEAYWVDQIRPAYLAAKEASPLTAVFFWLIPQFLNATWAVQSGVLDGEALGVLAMGWVGSGKLEDLLRHRPHRYSLFSVTNAVKAIVEAKPALAFKGGEKRGVAAASVRLPRRA